MANLQVKRVPDDLYARAKQRAADEGVSLSAWVIRTLRKHLAAPSREEWLSEVQAARGGLAPIDTQKYLDDARDEIENA